MNYVVVGLAGFLGAVTRALISNVAFHDPAQFPLNTLIINLSGSMALGFILTLTTGSLRISPSLRLALSTGFLGAYTTFSTLALETVNLMRSGHTVPAVSYVMISIVGGIMCAWAGAAVARKIAHLSVRPERPRQAQRFGRVK